MQLREGVEYRALYLWFRPFEALIASRSVNLEYAPAHMGDVLVLREDGNAGSRRGHYVMLAELVAVRDQCRGEVRSFVWRFENLREVEPRPGQVDWPVGRGGELGRVSFIDDVCIVTKERS